MAIIVVFAVISIAGFVDSQLYIHPLGGIFNHNVDTSVHTTANVADNTIAVAGKASNTAENVGNTVVTSGIIGTGKVIGALGHGVKSVASALNEIGDAFGHLSGSIAEVSADVPRTLKEENKVQITQGIIHSGHYLPLGNNLHSGRPNLYPSKYSHLGGYPYPGGYYHNSAYPYPVKYPHHAKYPHLGYQQHVKYPHPGFYLYPGINPPTDSQTPAHTGSTDSSVTPTGLPEQISDKEVKPVVEPTQDPDLTPLIDIRTGFS